MRSAADDIREFHERFDLAYAGPPRPLPGNLPRFADTGLALHAERLRDLTRREPENLLAFRLGFLFEELREYEIAVRQGNLENQLDALVDLVYVALGTAYLQGFDLAEAWRRVQAANLQKVRGDAAASKRGSAHDVVKPEGWVPPDLSDLVGR
jgi:predicted HAD superfamily Cof-like phosphohydrolase